MMQTEWLFRIAAKESDGEGHRSLVAGHGVQFSEQGEDVAGAGDPFDRRPATGESLDGPRAGIPRRRPFAKAKARSGSAPDLGEHVVRSDRARRRRRILHVDGEVLCDTLHDDDVAQGESRLRQFARRPALCEIAGAGRIVKLMFHASSPRQQSVVDALGESISC